MSKTGSPTPWSIKGIGPEAREAAKAAAKREGMTLGAWLSERVIAESKGGGSESAQETTGETTAGVVAPDIILAALHDHLSGLNDRLDGMAAEVSRVSGAVDQAGMRVEAAERATTEIAESVSQTVAGSISELMEAHTDRQENAPHTTGQLSEEASQALAEVITQRVTEAVNQDLSGKIEQSVNAETMGQSVSAAVMRAVTPAIAEQVNRSIAPVTTRLDRLDATAADSAVEQALSKISNRIDEALTKQQEIASAVGEAVAVLAQRLDTMESTVLAELEDQALQSQHALARDIDLTPPARKWLQEGGDVWAEHDDEADDPSLHLPEDATKMFKPEPEQPADMMRLDVAAVRARLGRDEANTEASELKHSLSTLKDMLPEQEADAGLDAPEVEESVQDAASSTQHQANLGETAVVAEDMPNAAAPHDVAEGKEEADPNLSIEEMVQDAVSQYSVLQRMSEEARRLTKDSPADPAGDDSEAQAQATAQDFTETEDITERNRRLDRELELELQRALALKPDPTIATTLDLGGVADDHLVFKPRRAPSPDQSPQAAAPQGEDQDTASNDPATDSDSEPPARRMGPRIADLLADRIENLAPLREQAQNQPAGEPRKARHFASDDDASSSPPSPDQSFGADRSERAMRGDAASSREMKLSHSRDLVAVFDEVEMWSDHDDASALSRARSASLVLLGAGSLLAAVSAMYVTIGA